MNHQSITVLEWEHKVGKGMEENDKGGTAKIKGRFGGSIKT